MTGTTEHCHLHTAITRDAIVELLANLSLEDRQYVASKFSEDGVSNATTTDTASQDGSMGWTEIIVLFMGGLLLIHMTGMLLWEIRRYGCIPACSEKAVSHYLKYRFSLWYSKTPGASSIVLVCMSVALLVVGGTAYSFVTEAADASVAESLWAAWIWIVAPDGGGSAEGYYGRIAGLCVSCGGMLIFAMLMSIVSAKFEETLDMFKNEGLPVVEGGHVVILGWSPMVPFLVRELCSAKEASGGCVMVILSPVEKVAVEELLEEADIDFKNTQVVVRTGDRWKSQDLEHVALDNASLVIVVSRHDVAREDSDARQLNVLSAMRTRKWPINGTVLVQCMLHINRHIFANYCHSEKKEVVTTGDLLGSLMVNCTSQRGLAQATLQTLGFEGSEIYILKVAGVAGKSFRELIFGLPGAVPLGIAHGENLELLPAMDTLLCGEERIILLADDESTCPTQVDESLSQSSIALGADKTLSVKASLQEKLPKQEGEIVVIIGWNETIGVVLVKLDKLLASGSTVVIFSPVPISDREEFIRAALGRRGKEKYNSFTVEHYDGPLCARSRLEVLPLRMATKIFMLADSSTEDPRAADGNTVAVALQVKDIITSSEQNSQDSSTVSEQVIVPQIRLASTAEHFKSMGLPDYILSDSLVAAIIAQVSCNGITHGILDELLDDEGCGLCVRRSEEYPELSGQIDKLDVTFAKLAARAVLAGEVAVGFKLTMSAYEEWTLNPQNRNASLEWTAESRIVSLRRFT